jgi:hypothetical protein
LKIQKSFQLKLFLGRGGTARIWAQQSQHTAHQYNKNRNIPEKRTQYSGTDVSQEKRIYDLLGAHMDPKSKHRAIKKSLCT